MSTADTDPPTRLARRLTLGDAVVVGLGAMIGAGVFAAIGPAADAAGGGLLLGLGIAAIVAYCNATSSARLAAVYPASGGTYVYGRARLGPFWGFLAGWGFVVGKTASCAAMALTFGAYAAPAWQRPIAVAAVGGLTAEAGLALGLRKFDDARRERLRAVLDRDLGGGLQVVVPVGVGRRAAFRGEDGDLVALDERHERDLSDLAALGPDGVQDDEGGVAELGRLAAVGPELRDDLCIPVAHGVRGYGR